MDTNITAADLKAAADEAVALVAKVQDLLPLDDGMLAHDRKVASIRLGVPTEAIETAVSVLENLGDKGSNFDIEQAREALVFESELGRVVLKLRLLADRTEATILKRRSKAVATPGGLYKSLQGMARTDGTVAPHVERLKPHLTRTRKAGAKSAQAPEATTSTAPTGNGHAVAAPSATITPAGVVATVTKP